jgi:uncharacterized protein (DUF1778 family)
MKERRITVRLDEATYQALQQDAQALGVSMGEYVRRLTLRSDRLVKVAMIQMVVEATMTQVVNTLDRLQQHWRDHPEALLQLPDHLVGGKA